MDHVPAVVAVGSTVDRHTELLHELLPKDFLVGPSTPKVAASYLD
jgi:hypothetical protein